MALNATTLTAAIGVTDTVVAVASATGITAPNYQVGDPTKGIASGVVYLLVEEEMMKVVGVNGLFVQVVRGELGSQASTHGVSVPCMAGLPTDFPAFSPAEQTAVPVLPLKFQGFSAPVAVASNVVVPSGPYFHLTGTTIVKSITVPAGYVQGGELQIVFDGSGAGLTWDATGNINVAGTSGTAGTMVTFIFDAGITKWIPSRIL